MRITLDDEQFRHVVCPGWQSESLAGIEADSSAFLRRVTSLLRDWMRACISPTIFSQRGRIVPCTRALEPVIILAELLVGEPGDDRIDLRGAERILGLPLWN